MDFRSFSPKNKKELGKLGEEMAAAYLEQQGLTILGRNYRCPKGEMDIIALEKDCLVFVEVRSRSSDFRGTAEESVRFAKLQRLKAIASYYLLEQKRREWPPLRFDIIAINFSGDEPRINWIRNVG